MCDIAKQSSNEPLVMVMMRKLVLEILRYNCVVDQHLLRSMFLLAFHFGLRAGEMTSAKHNLQLGNVSDVVVGRSSKEKKNDEALEA